MSITASDTLARLERDSEIAQRWRSLHPDTLLRGSELAEALSALGFKTSHATVTTWRNLKRRDGPPFKHYGRTPLYRWGDVLDWLTQRRAKKATVSKLEAR
jgi:hypothetical protein